MTAKILRGAVSLFTPDAGSSPSAIVGAMIDSLNVSLGTITSGTTNTLDLTNTVYDDGVSAFGTAFVQTVGIHPGFIVPTGGDGRYDIELFWFLLATATSFPVQFGFRSNTSSATGSYIQQVRQFSGTLAHYSGMSNNGAATKEAAATVIAQGVPLVAADELTWFCKQESGANRTVDYVRFSLKKVA